MALVKIKGDIRQKLIKSIFLKNILAQTVSHRNLQKLPQLFVAK